MNIIWAVAIAVFIAAEAATVGLVSIWFAVGALGALITSVLGAKLWLQILVFAALTVITLLLTRPLVSKYINGKSQPTNADRLIGAKCIVTEEINNLTGTGAVNAGGKIWTARSADDSIIAAGSLAKAERIEGVKLIVSPCGDGK